MANIRINSLPATTMVLADDVIPMDGATTRKIKPSDLLTSVRPFATQSEAEAGVNAAVSMSPLTTAQAVAAQLPSSGAGRNLLASSTPAAQRGLLGLGDSSVRSVGATAGTVAAGDDGRITGAAQKSANLSDLVSAAASRTNLGLGTSAVLNTGTSAGNVVALDGSAKLPAVDGSQLTGIPGALTDGDKGDIDVSSSGTVWTVGANAIDDTKVSPSAAISSAKLAFLQGVSATGVAAATRSLENKVRELKSVTDFKTASGDPVDLSGLTDSSEAMQAAFDDAIKSGYALFCPAGFIRLDTGLDASQTRYNGSGGLPGDVQKFKFFGAGSSNTIIIWKGGAGPAFTIGGTELGTNPVGYIAMGGFCIQGDGASAGNGVGIQGFQTASLTLDDILFTSLETGCVMNGIISSELTHVTFEGCLKGADLVTDFFSSPNAVGFQGCKFRACAEFGLRVGGGCSIVCYSGTFESCGKTGVGTDRGGIVLRNMGIHGPAAFAAYGTYFEANGGKGDLWIDHGGNPATYTLIGTPHTRNVSTVGQYPDHLITLDVSAPGAKLALRSVGMVSNGSYASGGLISASRRFIGGTQSADYDFIDDGNFYGSTVERPLLLRTNLDVGVAGTVQADGTAGSLPNSLWASSIGAPGVYTVTHNLNIDPLKYAVNAALADANTGSIIQCFKATNAFIVATVDAAGTAANRGFSFELRRVNGGV